MLIETHSKTQSFKGVDTEAVSEEIDRWAEENRCIITNIALVYIPQREADLRFTTRQLSEVQAIVTYNISINLKIQDA